MEIIITDVEINQVKNAENFSNRLSSVKEIICNNGHSNGASRHKRFVFLVLCERWHAIIKLKLCLFKCLIFVIKRNDCQW